MARLTLPSRLELKRCEGSGSDAPFGKVSFTTLLYVSPVQTMPWQDQTGVFHFHSSTIPGCAARISARSLASSSPRQSRSSAMRASISSAGGLPASYA